MGEVTITLVRRSVDYETIAMNIYADLGLTYRVLILPSWWFDGNDKQEVLKAKQELEKCRKFGRLVCVHGIPIFDKYFSELKED